MNQFYCIQCGQRIESLPGMSGQEIDCPGCGKMVTVPKPTEPRKVSPESPFADAKSQPPFSGGELFRQRIRFVLGVCIVGFFAVGAIAGILSTISLNFGEVQAKVMLTTVSLGAYCLTGLCSSILLDKPTLKPFAIVGIVISAIGAGFAFLTNWEIVQGWELVLKGRFSLIVLAIAHAHASLLLMIQTDNRAVQYLRILVLCTIAVLASVLVSMTQGLGFVESIWPILPITIILDVFGTLSIPVLHFATKK